MISPEVTTHVLSFLDPQDLARCCCVCHEWNELANHESLWMRHQQPIEDLAGMIDTFIGSLKLNESRSFSCSFPRDARAQLEMFFDTSSDSRNPSKKETRPFIHQFSPETSFHSFQKITFEEYRDYYGRTKIYFFVLFSAKLPILGQLNSKKLFEKLISKASKLISNKKTQILVDFKEICYNIHNDKSSSHLSQGFPQ